MASLSDDFNRASLNTGGSFIWASVGGGTWQILSSTQLAITAGANVALRAESDLASADHYAQIKLVNAQQINQGVCCRFSASAQTFYTYFWRQAQGQYQIFKCVAGTYTLIGAGSTVSTANDVAKVQANGSTISAYLNGSATPDVSVTDTAITGNTRTGVHGNTAGTFDDFSAADLAAGGGTTYTLTASGGSYTLTGQAASLKASRKLTAAAGSYSLTGNDATLTYQSSGSTYTLAANAGSFTLTGIAAVLKAGRKLAAGTGSFALTGKAAGLRRGFTLSAGIGSYSLTGVASTFSRTRRLVAGVGSFALTGRDATLIYDSFEADIIPDTALTGLFSYNTSLHARYSVNTSFDGRKAGR